MQKQIELLMKLQDIDYFMGELERSKDYLPGMMEDLRNEMNEITETLNNHKKRLEEARLEQKSLEVEIAASNEALEKYQQQMLKIKTNKEYDALTQEIDRTKEAISLAEDKTLLLMDEISELEEKIADYESRSEDTETRNKDQIDQLQNQIDSVGEKMKMKEAERQNVLVRIPKPLMSAYERIRKGRGGDVVVPVKRRSCGACYKQLEPRIVQEIRKADKVITCDSCGRILYWAGDDD
jgi:predicted  nucleic acid-binding Zn-ribbon protein